MRERFRSFDSKISFFAFADIITAVSGMLIFITLLLATDLGHPTDSRSQSINSEIERQLQQTLAQQAEADSENRRLQDLLAAANTAPDVDKLRSDISRLQAELADEKKKHASIAEQLAASKSAIDSQDRTLGLTDVRESVERANQELEDLLRQEAQAWAETAVLEQRVNDVQSTILKLRSREGQIWLIPDRSSTTKEPILVTVNGNGAKAERFDHPEQTRDFSKSTAVAEFDSYLETMKPLDQYIVFEIEPNGIGLFENLVEVARKKGFKVGFDALKPGEDVHFATPPPLDDKPVPAATPNAGTNTAPTVANPPQTQPPTAPATATNSPAQPAVNPPPAPKTKSWWQRLLEFIGIK